MRIPLSMIVLAGAVAVAGCSDKGLRDLRAPGTGPDEFMIMPVKPLTMPPDTQVLPAPTPGGENLTDIHPEQEAIAALGGRPEAMVASGGIPASDGALVTAASRNGVEPNIRDTLARQDAEFRRRQGRMTRIKLFPVDRYSQAYRKQALDPFPVTEAFRRRGYETPTSPPATQ